MDSKTGKKAKEGEVVAREGRPPSFQDPDEFSKLVDQYFADCNLIRDLPTITGLAVYLDTDRRTLVNYAKKDEFFPTIKRARAKCEAAIESRAMLGGLNPAMAIFSLKNNYGWIDKQEVDNKHELVKPILTLEDGDGVHRDDSNSQD